MLKKLTKTDVTVDLKDSDFKPEPKEKDFHSDYFVFQIEALKQIRLALDNPQFFRHFIITGEEGSGKRSSVVNLLRKEYSEKIKFPKKYYFRKSNTIVTDPEIKEGLTPLFDPDAETTPVIFDATPNTMSLVGIPTEKKYYPGNLVKAAGGFLILPISKLVEDPIVYDLLKSCLLYEQIDFINLPEKSFFQPLDRTLPQFPLDARIILIGEDHVYEQLLKKDHNLHEVFKMKVDLETEAELTKKNIARFSNLIDTLSLADYPPPNPSAKKRLLEEALKLNESKTKFTLNIAEIKSIYEESMVFAKSKKDVKGASLNEADIELALQNIEKRESMPKKKYYEDLKNGMYNMSLTGKRLGRINGLSILTPFTSHQEFGQVNVISSRALMGTGNFINIEREVNLSGDVHDKGVFILQSYLKGLFSNFASLGVDISILFEQSHFVVDGDSASVAELIATLSALSGAEIPCNIAVTGSMSQYGEIMPVGAINQKIEAWYSISKLLGSPREIYSVYIPTANAKDLILNPEIRKAVGENKFNIYSFSHVADVIPEILKLQLGKIEKDGKYTQDSILRRIEDRLEKKKEEKEH
jgi:predicted ATP-dependent protease